MAVSNPVKKAHDGRRIDYPYTWQYLYVNDDYRLPASNKSDRVNEHYGELDPRRDIERESLTKKAKDVISESIDIIYDETLARIPFVDRIKKYFLPEDVPLDNKGKILHLDDGNQYDTTPRDIKTLDEGGKDMGYDLSSIRDKEGRLIHLKSD